MSLDVHLRQCRENMVTEPKVSAGPSPTSLGLRKASALEYVCFQRDAVRSELCTSELHPAARRALLIDLSNKPLS